MATSRRRTLSRPTIALAGSTLLAAVALTVSTAAPASADKPSSGSSTGTGQVFKVNPVQSSGNQGLSVRRAQAVANELVRDGVPKDVISIQGFGDTHLLVPTGPGVREPQNRRVEIIIR